METCFVLKTRKQMTIKHKKVAQFYSTLWKISIQNILFLESKYEFSFDTKHDRSPITWMKIQETKCSFDKYYQLICTK